MKILVKVYAPPSIVIQTSLGSDLIFIHILFNFTDKILNYHLIFVVTYKILDNGLIISHKFFEFVQMYYLDHSLKDSYVSIET